jgi:hypothetical protein
MSYTTRSLRLSSSACPTDNISGVSRKKCAALQHAGKQYATPGQATDDYLLEETESWLISITTNSQYRSLGYYYMKYWSNINCLLNAIDEALLSVHNTRQPEKLFSFSAQLNNG